LAQKLATNWYQNQLYWIKIEQEGVQKWLKKWHV
jgi:hypothetical protein